jgi:hypothetical protein
MTRHVATALTLAAVLHAGPSFSADALDYDYFKTRVEPIFLQKRPDHVRCYVCHSENNSAFKLEKLQKGQSFWTEEQSRKNFEVVSHLVVPGKPDASLLLMRPLALQAGGFPYHSGGRQFESREDPEWKAIAAWVSGAKAK